MADLETLDGVLATEVDPVAQMSVVPLATRMRMASEDDNLTRPNYYHIDDALRMSYDEIMSKQTDTQLLAKRKAEASTTSDVGEIIRATTENYITNALNKPEKAVLAIGNYMSAAGIPIGREWANWANEAINDYLDQNLTSQRAGDAETWASRITGGVLSAAEYMMAGMVARPLADVSMGIDILGQATKNDIDRYIAETGDTALADYKANWKDVAINTLNVGAQLYIEDKLGFGRVLNYKTHGLTEFLAGFVQEFFQGTLEDVAESAKGNQEWAEVWNGVIGNVKDGVVGALLQGPLGLAAHHHYVSNAERQMKDFFVKNGMEEKAAQQKAHDLRLQLEKEIAPMVVKQDKDIYDLVAQKGSVWGSTYDVAYNAIRLTDTTGMTNEQIDARATEIANQIASTVLERVVNEGLDLSEARIGFNPADNTVYVNDKKTLDVKQALKEIEELDAEPATKEDAKQVVAEQKKVEETKKADQTKPVSAIDPKAPFNKTKEKSPAVKALVNGVSDGTIKMNKTEQVRYANLLRDKQDGKPTTNEQMEKFAQKMVDKYMPSKAAEEKAPTTTAQPSSQVSAQPSGQVSAQPETQDRSRWQEGEKKRKQVERLEKDTGVSLEDVATDSVERIKAEQEEASRLIKENGVQYAEKVLKGEIKSDIITGAWVMALDTAASEGNMEAALLLSTLPEIKGEIVMLSEYARQLAGWKNMMKDSMVSVLDVEKSLEANIKKSIGEKKAQKNVAEMKAKLKTAVESALQSQQLEQNSNSFLDSKVC